MRESIAKVVARAPVEEAEWALGAIGKAGPTETGYVELQASISQMQADLTRRQNSPGSEAVLTAQPGA